MALFDYIELFYNQRRQHSTLGQISAAAADRLLTLFDEGRRYEINIGNPSTESDQVQ